MAHQHIDQTVITSHVDANYHVPSYYTVHDQQHHDLRIEFARLHQPHEITHIFFDLFQKVYEHKGKDNNARYGPIDVYHLHHHSLEKIHIARDQQQKGYQPHLSEVFNAQHQGHILHDYREFHVWQGYRGEIPKWLPERIGVKTVPFRPDLKEAIDHSLGNLAHKHFTQVFGAQQRGNDLLIYFEFADDNRNLENEISNRKRERNPFSEDLLWQLLYTLIRAAEGIDHGVADIRPSKVFYRQFQPSLNPRLLEIPQFATSQPPLFKNRNANPGAHQDLASQYNVAFQIGCTVLAAGLLRNEKTLNFAPESLPGLLEDFGKLYGTQDHLLQFTLQELFLLKNQHTPRQIFDGVFGGRSNLVVFLESCVKEYQPKSTFKENLQRFFQQPEFQTSYFNFVHSHPTVVHKHLPLDFLDRYQENLYFVRAQVRFEQDMERHHHNAQQVHSSVHGQTLTQSHASIHNSQIQGSQIRVSQQRY